MLRSLNCPSCGYDLRAVAVDIHAGKTISCSECGASINQDILRRAGALPPRTVQTLSPGALMLAAALIMLLPMDQWIKPNPSIVCTAIVALIGVLTVWTLIHESKRMLRYRRTHQSGRVDPVLTFLGVTFLNAILALLALCSIGFMIEIFTTP
ncbi:MAG: hypothetical protein AAF432_16260 [Planctomycetota bacterium]